MEREHMRERKKIVMRAILIVLTVSLLMQGVILVLPDGVRAYQMVIQPSDIDSHISQANPTTNYGKDGTAGIGSGPMTNNRFLLKFDLSSLGQGYVVTNAVLTVQGPTGVTCIDFDLPTNVHAYRARTYWGESSVTWNKEPDYAAEPSGEDSDVQMGILDFEITDLVQDWYDGTFDNYGVMLRMAHEGGDSEGDACSNGFFTRDPAPPPWPSTEPKLTIDYEDPQPYVDVEIVEPKMAVDPPEEWDAILSNNCTCPTLKSRVDYYGTLVDVRYEITIVPGDTWFLTLPATYDEHTGLWVAELDCSRMDNLGDLYHYKIEAKATVIAVATATDSILVKVDNEWHTDRLAWVYYYFDPGCVLFPLSPSFVYADFNEYDGKHELFSVDIESTFRTVASQPTFCIDVVVPDYWNPVTVNGLIITNLPNSVVNPTAPPPGSPPNTNAYRIISIDPVPVLYYSMYMLWFLVENPWYR